MTETTEAPAQAVTEAPQTPAPAETPASTSETTAAPETPSAAPETPEEPAKPKPADRRFAVLTAKLSAEAEARKALESKLAAAEALIRAGKPEGEQPPAPPAETIEQAAARLVAQKEFDRDRQSLITQGVKELGEEAWNEKTSSLGAMGATDNQAFMQALVEIPDAHKLVAKLADDPDGLVELLGKSPAAMAAAMGRMAAEISRPQPRPQSQAPKPVTPISAPAVVPEPDPYDEKMSMSDYVALRRKTAPRHLGGSGRSA